MTDRQKSVKSTFNIERKIFFGPDEAVSGPIFRFQGGAFGGASLNCINFTVTMNPCPCGFYPDRGRCRCTDPQIRRYMGRVSGPILDRIDLCVELQPVDIAGLKKERRAESSSEIRVRVQKARERQRERFAGTKCRFNVDIEGTNIERYCSLDGDGQALMERLYHSLQLSARAYHRILKVARTIADLEGAEKIGTEHLLEASFYRPSAEYWGV